MKEIQVKTRSVRELQSDTQYGIDYYQGEYKWQAKQIIELMFDQVAAFREKYQPLRERKNVAEHHTDEFSHAKEFSAHRNRIGGFVLSPKKFNGRLNDKTYNDVDRGIAELLWSADHLKEAA